MIRPKFFAILAFILLCGLAIAEDAPSIIQASDKDALTASVDKDAVVEGDVDSAAWLPSGKIFVIKFKGAEASGLQVVVFTKNKEAMEKGLGGEMGAALTGQKIQVKGKVVLYRDKPEIVISAPAQITIVKPPDTTNQTTTPTATATPADTSQPAGPYSKLELTEEQKQKIATIQKEAAEAQKAQLEKLQAEADAKIDLLLTDPQRKQVADLKAQEKSGVKDVYKN